MARSLWQGSIAFGLVDIPVELFQAVRDRSIRYHRMSPDGTCRLRTQLYCPETGQEYDYTEAARGYEIAPDRYVVLNDDEIAALRPEIGDTIAIEDFVSLDEIDPVYFDRPYWLGPGEGGARAYRLLYEALTRSRKIGIGRFVLRDKEHLTALRAASGALCLSTMTWADEVIAAGEVVEIVSEAVDERQLALATDLVAAMTRPFEPAKYEDRYRAELRALIERRAAGEPAAVPRAVAPTRPEMGRAVVDLTDALERSLTEPQSGAAGGRRTASG